MHFSSSNSCLYAVFSANCDIFFALCFPHFFRSGSLYFMLFKAGFESVPKIEIFFEPLEKPFERKLLTGTPFCLKTCIFCIFPSLCPLFSLSFFFLSFFPVLCKFLFCSFGPPGLHFRGTFFCSLVPSGLHSGPSPRV